MKNITKKRFVIIDGCGLLFRAYYAVPQMLSQDNFPVGAIYGFIQSLKFIINRLIPRKNSIPTMLAIALDIGGGENFRYKIYGEYKKNRKSIPEDLVSQLKLIRPMLDAFGITYISDPTCEADDIIATYTKYAVQNNYDVTIISSDKDLMQLISQDVSFFDINKKKFCSENDVFEKFLVTPKQICDYLSIVGDRADNIPGVRGIGKKIASELLNKFQTLESIYDNLHAITEIKIKSMLENGYESAMLSKKLVTLNDSVQLHFSMDELQWHGFHAKSSSISDFLSQYSLESLIGVFK